MSGLKLPFTLFLYLVGGAQCSNTGPVFQRGVSDPQAGEPWEIWMRSRGSVDCTRPQVIGHGPAGDWPSYRGSRMLLSAADSARRHAGPRAEPKASASSTDPLFRERTQRSLPLPSIVNLRTSSPGEKCIRAVMSRFFIPDFL